jgi:hypothetical protein
VESVLWMFAAHRDGDGFLLAHQNHKALTAGDAGIEQIALQHGVVLGHDRDHDGGVLRALALMDGCCVGRHQGVELAKAVGDRTPKRYARRSSGRPCRHCRSDKGAKPPVSPMLPMPHAVRRISSRRQICHFFLPARLANLVGKIDHA